jgi:hypothetical protein
VNDVDASLKVERAEGKETDCKLELWGVGLGSKFSFDVTVRDFFETKNDSLKVNCELAAVWQKCRIAQ